MAKNTPSETFTRVPSVPTSARIHEYACTRMLCKSVHIHLYYCGAYIRILHIFHYLNVPGRNNENEKVDTKTADYVGSNHIPSM